MWTPGREINPPEFNEQECSNCGASTDNGSLCKICEEEVKSEEKEEN